MVNARGPFRFLLDTGARSCLVSPILVDELGLSVTKSSTGKDQVLGGLDSVEVAGQVRHKVRGMVEDVSYVEVEGPLHGYIGHDFLRHFKVSLDYRNCWILLE
jgi:predicted aspartyl protease